MGIFRLIIVAILLCLTSCSRATTNHEAIGVVHNSVNTLEQSLPKECKTKAIQSQIDGLHQQLAVAESRCDDAIRQEKTNTVKWKTAFFGLLLVIGVWVVRKFII